MPEVWKIDFYTGDDGSLPVRAWLDTVPQDVRGKVLARIELLRTGGPTLDYPYTSQIEGKLREASHESRLAARTGQKTAPRTPAKENKRR